MPDRALIIAIERYDKARDGFTAKELAGTLAAGLAFRDWLREKWKQEGKLGGEIFFCSEPQVAGGRGADGKSIVDALIELGDHGRDQTDTLFVYFSGHGFRLAGETIKLADVLVAADFEDVRRSAASCFKLDALVDGLRTSLGHGTHFYFIDACRNEVTKAIASSIMPFDGQGSEEPSVFVLQSTIPGAPALVAGPFAKRLMEGLRGAGKAKVWEPPATDSMKVRFDSLRKYLKEQLKDVQPITQVTSGELGESDVVLATIAPVKPVNLSIVLDGTGPVVSGTALIAPFGGGATQHPITAATTVVPLPPNDYKVSVAVDQGGVTPDGAVDVSLYEDRETRFTVGGRKARDIGAGAAVVRNVTVSLPTGTELVMRHLGSGVERTFAQSEAATLPAGAYATVYRSRQGELLRRSEVVVEAERHLAVAPAAWAGAPALESIAKRFPQHDGGVDFSESLGGPIVDPDPDIWLAILAGGRVIGSQANFNKIAALPLAEFSNEVAGASPVYVLAALPESRMKLRVGLGRKDAPIEWTTAKEPRGMKGVYEAVMHPAAGQTFVTLAVGDQPAYTVTTLASPNRCTSIVLSLGDDGQPRVGQYLLPIGHLVDRLEPFVQGMLASRNPLKDVHTLALLTRAFRKRRRIETEFGSSQLVELLYAKWLDPIATSIATYECVRRNVNRDLLPTVAGNMRMFFGDLPDTPAIARLAGVGSPPPIGVPLFLDGLRAFPDHAAALEPWMPHPAGLLDYSGPWTVWRGAVDVPRR